MFVFIHKLSCYCLKLTELSGLQFIKLIVFQCTSPRRKFWEIQEEHRTIVMKIGNFHMINVKKGIWNQIGQCFLFMEELVKKTRLSYPSNIKFLFLSCMVSRQIWLYKIACKDNLILKATCQWLFSFSTWIYLKPKYCF